MRSVRIRIFSGPYFTAFGLNTDRYYVSLRIHSECGKIRTRKTLNRDTFHAVYFLKDGRQFVKTKLLKMLRLLKNLWWNFFLKTCTYLEKNRRKIFHILFNAFHIKNRATVKVNRCIFLNINLKHWIVIFKGNIYNSFWTEHHCVKSVRIRSFLVRIFPHSDWVRRDTD